MGQFGPSLRSLGLIDGSHRIRLFAVGLLVTSTLAFSAVYFLGAATESLIPAIHYLPIPIALLLSLTLSELASLLAGRDISIGLRRQTPRQWGHSRVGLVFWGLDTGLPWSTVRSSILTWVALLLCFYQLAPWFSGALYSAGFIGAILFLSATAGSAPSLSSTGVPALQLHMRQIRSAVPVIRVVSMLLAGAVATALAVLGVSAQGS